MVTLTATPTPICVANTTGRTWSIIGPAGADWSTDKALAYDCYTQTFKATMKLNAGDFKFRANNDWGTNLGGTGNLANGVTLTANGSNLTITTAGTYTITLAPSADGASGTATVK